MMKYLKKALLVLRDSCEFLGLGFKKNLKKAYFKAFILNFYIHLNKFHHYILQTLPDHAEQCKTLQERAKGLHLLLPNPENFTYSILIALDRNPNPKLFRRSLLSACMQTAPNMEILIGAKSFIPEDLKIIQEAQHTHPDRIKCFTCDEDTLLCNLLAEKAKGKFLLFLDPEDCLRPDLLFRYEQLLRAQPSPTKTVVNCAENEMDAKGQLIPSFPLKKTKPHFPYIFQSIFDTRGLLIPKVLWDQTGGIRKEFAGAEIDDLLLRLDLAGAHFEYIPIPLYYRHAEAKKSDIHIDIFSKALKDYANNKDLDWTFEQGYLSNSVRAIPKQKDHHIQVIIPFKDQKELTLKCIDSIIKQKGVKVQITAVDNRSDDTTIALSIEDLGGEVLRIDEPFNYSRLNNLAVAKTKKAKECDLVLFLNNDVELDENALSEMVRWIDQPSIGMVGARLHYPNGMLQHGGVRLHEYLHEDHVSWEHIEKLRSFDEMKETKVHAIMDAVTAACSLIKKEHFLQVGGFDEIWYPIGFSDTSLAMKLKKIGLKSFYTPYAFGIHHESISRKYSLEDVDGSRWLHELILK